MTISTIEKDAVTIRFAGDSGDGMQLTGSRFSSSSAIFGNDIATFPDYPAEIRAPSGTVAGVSGFQIQLADHDIYTPGDHADCLVAMNPAALKKCLPELLPNALVILNEDAFTPGNIEKAGFASNPLDDGLLGEYRIVLVKITSLTCSATGSLLPRKQAERCKNLFALGLTLWIFGRDTGSTREWIRSKFSKNAAVAEATLAALEAGYSYGETTDLADARYRVAPATVRPGTYAQVSGNEGIALGLVAAAQSARCPLFYGSYPITPATDILHELASLSAFDVTTFQAEDEIAAMCSTIGAAFAGSIAVTGTSGPGLCLKSEAINLAVMTELPMVIVNVQRGGPSTGLPTKTEQSDLLQALYGRNGESPLVILAPQSPSDCYAIAYEAVRIALRIMGPVIVLSDGYIGNGAEPWRIPEPDSMPPIVVRYATDPDTFQPYARDPETYARPWAIPGTPGLEHRIGGLEKQDGSGHVSYDPANHHRMMELRAEKVRRLDAFIPPQDVYGEKEGRLLILGWGGTFGAIRTAAERLRAEGISVSHAHLRYLNPFPSNLRRILSRFEHVLVPEINLGQMASVIRSTYLKEVQQLNQVRGVPLKVAEICARARQILNQGVRS